MQREIERRNDEAVGSARALRTGKTRTVGVLVPAAASVLLDGLASGTHSCRSMSVERVLKEGCTTRMVRPRLVGGRRAG